MTKAGSVGMKRIAVSRLVPDAVLIRSFDLKAPRNRCQVAGGPSFSSFFKEHFAAFAFWRSLRRGRLSHQVLRAPRATTLTPVTRAGRS